MTEPSATKKQLLFQELLIGSLIYTVVFGFFNDYTDILTTASYSTTFLAAITMMVMTFPVFKLKSWLVRKLKHKKLLMILSVWLVMFGSKFIFLAGIDLLFGDSVQISGFVGLIILIVCATVLQKLASYTYAKLGSSKEELVLG